MNILIEAIGIDKPGGGRTATLNLLENILQIDRENNYTIILSRHEKILEQFKNVLQIITPFRNRYLSRIWVQIIIPTKYRNVDLIHFTKNLSVFGVKVPHIITIHDLTPLVFPQFFPCTDVFYWKTIEKWAVKSANFIIAVSKNTGDDLVKYYGEDPKKIIIIYHGRSRYFFPVERNEIDKVLQKYRLPSRYIITVGRIDIKKNLSNLVRAFALIRETIDPEIKLVIIGEIYKKCEDKDLIPTVSKLGLQDRVIFLGRVPDEDLPALYSGTIACVFPSLHEGFGLVGLEAMSCGAPIITHNSSAIIEVVGPAGLKVDASKIDNLANAMEDVINNSNLQNSMRLAGLQKVKEFDWIKSAQLTLDLYKQVCGNGKS